MSKVRPLLSVLIVNYKSGEYLQKAVNSLKRQTFQDFEVVIIDNDSCDQALEKLDLAGLSDVRVFAETTNHGFAKGNNIAAKQATGEWLALLNPDAVARADWLENIVAGIERHPSCKVFACSQINMDNPSLMDGTGDAYLLFGVPWRGGFEHSIKSLPEEGRCFSPCGASAVYQRDLFLAHDGFDERFFCYCEDVDLGMRLRLSGEDCIFLPEAVIEHKGSAVSGRHSYFTMFHGNRNRTWAYIKNMPLSLLILTLPIHMLFVTCLYVRNRNRFDHSGMVDGIKAGFQDGWALRRSSDYRVPERKTPMFSFVRAMAWNPFRMARRAVHVRPL